MWFFRNKRTVEQSGLFENFVDWHSHLLPGVDDGVQTLDETIKLLRRMKGVGVNRVVLTPHVMEEMPNEPLDLLKRFADLQESCKDIGVELRLAAENMLDSLFVKRMSENNVIAHVHENRLLVETSYFSPPFDLYGLLTMVASAGYFPVLAHPERYQYMTDSDYDRLKKMDVMFQLNVPSLFGAYGREAFDKGNKLLRKGYYSLCGLDIHRYTQYDNLLRAEVPNKLYNTLKPLIEKSNSQF